MTYPYFNFTRVMYSEASERNHPPIVRQEIKDEILGLIDRAISDKRNDTKRLILVQGNTGTGKTWLLEEISADLRVKYGAGIKVTERYRMAELADQLDATYGKLRDLCQACFPRGVIPKIPDARNQDSVLQLIQQLLTAYDANQAASSGQKLTPLIVVLDDMEVLTAQQQPSTSHFRAIRNAFLLRLIALAEVPIIFLCAARMPSENSLNYLSYHQLRETTHQVFLKATLEDLIDKLNKPEEQQKFIREKSAGNPLLAQFFSTPGVFEAFYSDGSSHPNRQDVLRQAIDICLEECNLDPNLKDVATLSKFAKTNSPFRPETPFPDDSSHFPARPLITSGLARFDSASGDYSIVGPLSSLLQEVQI